MPTYKWSNDGLKCTATRVCDNNKSHVETETVKATSKITKHATCENTGIKAFTATFKNPAFTTQTTTSTISALGHNYGTPTYNWSSDKSTCTAIRTCSVDGYAESETVKTTNIVTKDSTFTEKGIRTYTAKFNNTAFGTNIVTEEIPMKTSLIEGRTYYFGESSVPWVAAEVDNTHHTAVLQSVTGVSYNMWPGYTYDYWDRHDIDGQDISNYDNALSSLYREIKWAENTNAGYGKGLYLLSNEKAWKTNYNKALTSAANTNIYCKHAWLGSINNRNRDEIYAVAINGDINALTYVSKAMIAPAFNVDLTKIHLLGNQLFYTNDNMIWSD